MVTRAKLKTMIRYNLIQDTTLQSFLGTNYSKHILDAGQEIPSKEILYPAIRYKVVSDSPALLCRDCADRRDVIFDILIDTRKESKIQSDDLIDIIRNIMLNCDSIAEVTRLTSYQTDAGILTKTNNEPVLSATPCLEIGINQVGSLDENSNSSGDIAFDKLNGRVQHTMIRFTCFVMDQAVYT